MKKINKISMFISYLLAISSKATDLFAKERLLVNKIFTNNKVHAFLIMVSNNLIKTSNNRSLKAIKLAITMC